MAADPNPNPAQQTPQDPPRNPAPPNTLAPATSAPPAASGVSSEQSCVSLFDWWLVRSPGEEGRIAVAGFTKRNQAARIFTSAAIVKRYADGTLETADGIMILIQGPLNVLRMHENGFPDEVTKCFQIGFPIEWDNCTNLYMKQTSVHTGSPPNSTAAGSSKDSTQTYLEKFLLGSLVNSLGYALAGNIFNNSKRLPGNNTNSAPMQKLQESTHNTADHDGSTRKRPASAISDKSIGCAVFSQEVGNERMDLPVEPSVAPAEAHSKDQAEKEAGIQHGNTHTDASEREIVNNSFNYVLINNSTNHISSDVGVEIVKCTPEDLRTKDALTSVPNKDTSCLQFGAVEGSEYNTIRSLRNGKRFGTSNDASLKKGHYMKRMQHKKINIKLVPKELGDEIAICGPVDLTDEDSLTNAPNKDTSCLQFVSVEGSEHTAIRTLRNGKMFGSNSASLKERYRKRMPHKSFKGKLVANDVEGDENVICTTLDLTAKDTLTNVLTKDTSCLQFRAVGSSEHNAIRRLRNGKRFGSSSDALLEKGDYREKVQHEALNVKLVPNEEITTTADLSSEENVDQSRINRNKAKQFSVCTGGVIHQGDSGHQNIINKADASVAQVVVAELQSPQIQKESKSEPAKRTRRSH